MKNELLMNKLKNLTDPSDLSEADIEFLIGKNSMPKYPVSDSKNTTCVHTNDFSDSNDQIILNGPTKGVKIVLGKSNARKPTDNIVCSNCGKADTIINDQFGGMDVCTNCGSVIDSMVLDHSPEWTNYDDGTQVSNRCGMPTNALLPQSSLGTTIGGNCNYKLKTLHNWGLMPYKERSLNIVLNIIKHKCEEAGLLGCIEDDAKILYKIASECKSMTHTNNNIIIRGKNRIGLMAACIFYACKRRGQTKSLKEIASLFGVKTARINRGCKNFIKYVKYKNIDYNTNLSHPSQYINQFCEKLKLDEKHHKFILELATNVQKINIVPSHTPISVAAACILLYATENSIKDVDKHIISSSFNISEVTIVKAYAKMVIHKGILFNTQLIDKIIAKSSSYNKNIPVPDALVKRLKIVDTYDASKYCNVVAIDLYKYMFKDVTQHAVETYINCTEYQNSCNNNISKYCEQYFKIIGK